MSTHDGSQQDGPILDGWALQQIRAKDARIAELEHEVTALRDELRDLKSEIRPYSYDLSSRRA